MIENFAEALPEAQQKIIYKLRAKIKKAKKRYSTIRFRPHYEKTGFNDNKVVNTNCPKCGSSEKNQATCEVCSIDAVNFCTQCGYCFNIEGFHEDQK